MGRMTPPAFSQPPAEQMRRPTMQVLPSPEPGSLGPGEPCAETKSCQGGLTCTSELGACDRPPGCLSADICPDVCFGICAGPDPSGPRGASCRVDADCRTSADYCGGCRCAAVPVRAPDPRCRQRPANCVADPCRGQVAGCVEGACVLRASAE